MRLQFHDDELKDRLVELSKDLQISLNALVNMICQSQFSQTEKYRLDLMIEIANVSKNNLQFK